MESTYEYVMAQFANIDRARQSILTYQEIAEGSGESKRTVEKIARKEIVDPGVDHCERIAAFFQDLASMPGANQREQYEALMARRAQKAGVHGGASVSAAG